MKKIEKILSMLKLVKFNQTFATKIYGILISKLVNHM